MTVRAQRDAVPDTVSLFHSEDMVHVEEARIVLHPPSAATLAAVRG